MKNLKKIFKKENSILIGVIHLPPLLGIKGFSSMQKIINKALKDLKSLEGAGFDGALLENENDKPHTEFANSAQIASFTVIANEVCKKAKIPIGIQMMLNDWKSSFSIAKAVNASFTRLDVFVDNVTCDWGTIKPETKKIIEYKNNIYPELVLLTDIQVKYKKMIKPRSLTKSAKLAVKNESDCLIITGNATGEETPLVYIKEIRKNFPKFPIFVGAGINTKNIKEQLSFANGAIVGTSIKTGEYIDLKKAKTLKKLSK
jgi:membrane complex biogenesis BtpA family protein